MRYLREIDDLAALMAASQCGPTDDTLTLVGNPVRHHSMWRELAELAWSEAIRAASLEVSKRPSLPECVSALKELACHPDIDEVRPQILDYLRRLLAK